ncbi:MAG TPA: S9 family peptidase, partial [Candidatus Kapabacteria bacterium]
MPHSTPRLIPLRDFFRNPEQTSFRISPNGEYLSYTAPYEKRMNVFVEKRGELGAGNAVRVTSETDRDITTHGWKSETIIFTRDFDGDENFHLFSANKDGSNTRDLTPFPGVRVEIVDELQEVENEMLIGLNNRDPQLFDVYRLNVVTGGMQLIAENPGGVTDWVTDHTGAVRLAIQSDGVNNIYLYRDREGEEFRPVLSLSFRDILGPLFFSFDNKAIYALSNLGRDRLAAVKYDIANAKELEVICEHPEVDLAGMEYSRKRHVLTTITYVTWKKQREFLDN